MYVQELNSSMLGHQAGSADAKNGGQREKCKADVIE